MLTIRNAKLNACAISAASLLLSAGQVYSAPLHSTGVWGETVQPNAASTSSSVSILEAIDDGKAIAPEFDFGVVRSGSVVKHIFTVRNTGKTPLVLDRAVSSCECTSAVVLSDFPGEPQIKPGETARVQIELDTAKLPAASAPTLAGQEVEKLINVYTLADAVHAALVLRVHGRISSGMAFDPPSLNFGAVDTAKGASQTFQLIVDQDKDKPSQPRLISTDARVRIVPVKTETGKQDGQPTILSFRAVISPRAGVGPLSGAIAVDGAQNATSASYTAPFTGEVTGRFLAQPPMAVFGEIPQHDGFGKPILSAELAERRTRWILVVRKDAKSGDRGYWRKASASTSTQAFAVTMTPPREAGEAKKGTKVSGGQPPFLAPGIAPATAYWLRIDVKKDAPRHVWLSDNAIVKLPDETVIVPVQALVD